MAAAYTEKLADPRWQRKRLEIFNRDNWTCQCCGDKASQLEIHHTQYWPGKEPWEYPGDMLITVCHKCHGEEQVRFQYEKELITALRSTGIHAMEISVLAQMIFSSAQFRRQLKFSIKKFLEQL